MATHPTKAGFGIRFAAMIIDNLVLSIFLTPIFMLFFEENTLTDAQIEEILKTQGIIGLINLNELMIQQVFVLVLTAFFWVKFAGTPGKRLLRLRVVDADTGQNLTVMQSIIRYLGYFISALPLSLGFFWVLFDAKKQGWHDKLAGSIVVIDVSKDKKTQRDQPSSISQRNDDSFVA